MKRNGDSIHPCRSATPTVNDFDLTPSTRTQTSEQEYSDLTASNRRRQQHAPAATLHKVYHDEPGRMLSRGRQNM